MGRPNARVRRGTTKTPPPRPTSEPISPAAIEAANTRRKKSKCGGANISGSSSAQHKANHQDRQDHAGNHYIAPVALQAKGHNGDGDAQDRRCQQHQQSQHDDGERVATRQSLADADKTLRKVGGIGAASTWREIANIEEDDADEDDGATEQDASSQHVADDQFGLADQLITRIRWRWSLQLLLICHLVSSLLDAQDFWK